MTKTKLFSELSSFIALIYLHFPVSGTAAARVSLLSLYEKLQVRHLSAFVGSLAE
jgi:hypothetical protein